MPEKKTFGPAMADGRPLRYRDLGNLTVNTAKGIGRSMLKQLKGDSKGASEELDRTRAENREMSELAAKHYHNGKEIKGRPDKL